MANRIAPFGLRMPDDMKEWIAQRAKAEDRSQNNTIVRIIRAEMAAGAVVGAETPAAEDDEAALAGGSI